MDGSRIETVGCHVCDLVTCIDKKCFMSRMLQCKDVMCYILKDGDIPKLRCQNDKKIQSRKYFKVELRPKSLIADG